MVVKGRFVVDTGCSKGGTASTEWEFMVEMALAISPTANHSFEIASKGLGFDRISTPLLHSAPLSLNLRSGRAFSGRAVLT